jgi:hypothetical protein
VAIKYVPNGRKVEQMAILYTNIFPLSRPTKIYPNWDFGFENIPSGNPGFDSRFGAFFLIGLTRFHETG